MNFLKAVGQFFLAMFASSFIAALFLGKKVDENTSAGVVLVLTIILFILLRRWCKKRKLKKEGLLLPSPKSLLGVAYAQSEALAASDQGEAGYDQALQKIEEKAKEKKVKELPADCGRLLCRGVALSLIRHQRSPSETWNEGFKAVLPIRFADNEKYLYSATSTRILTTETQRSYEAGTRGVSVRVAKGVSFRVGGVGGTSVSQDVWKELPGSLVVLTTEALYYYANGVIQKIPKNKMVQVQATSHRSFRVSKEGVRGRPIDFYFQNSWEIDPFIEGLRN